MLRFYNLMLGLKNLIIILHDYFVNPSKIIDEIFPVPDMIDPTDSDDFYQDLSQSEMI